VSDEATQLIDLDPANLLDQGGVLVDVEVDGVPVPLDWTAIPTECGHGAVVNLETVVAFIKDEPDNPEAPVVDWQLRVRGRCGECGTHFDIAPTGRVPKDGGHGVVLALRPSDDAVT
jgi:hypothetical protein